MIRIRAAMLAALSLSGLLLGEPGTAKAHAILIASDPPLGGTLAAGPVALTLRYNSRIDAGRSKLTLTAPEGPPRSLAIASDTTPDTMAANAGPLAPGAYTLRWQVLAVDGHITRGDVAFTVVPH